MKINISETEIERLREEVRHLRSLLAQQKQAQIDSPPTQPSAAASVPNQEMPSWQEQALKEALLASLSDFVYSFDRAGRFVYINQALLDLWQVPREEALGKTFAELGYPDELAERLDRQIASVFVTGKPVRDETPFTGAAGEQGYYEYIFVPVFDGAGKVEFVAGSTRDFTQRQKVRDENAALFQTLQAEWERLSGLFMQAPAFIAILRGPEHIFERTNPSYEQLVGHRDLLGRSVRAAFPELEDQAFFEILDEVYRSGQPFIGQMMPIRFQAERGGLFTERYLDFVYQPLIEADGSVSGIFVHGVDITERREMLAKAQQNEEQMRRVAQLLEEKNREIEALNARLRRSMTETHHRVKNNLQLISALIDMQRGEDESEMVPTSELVRLSANVRALGVIHDVLTEEAKSDSQEETLSVKAVLEKLLSMLQQTIGPGHRLRYEIEDARIPGRKVTSLSLITNELFSNAIKHGNGAAEVRFEVRAGQASLVVRDAGAGFAPDFDPVTAANTGLTLIESISRHDLRGKVRYENAYDGGAEITLTFPVDLFSPGENPERTKDLS